MKAVKKGLFLKSLKEQKNVYKSAVYSGCVHCLSLASPTYNTAFVSTSETNKRDYLTLC